MSGLSNFKEYCTVEQKEAFLNRKEIKNPEYIIFFPEWNKAIPCQNKEMVNSELNSMCGYNINFIILPVTDYKIRNISELLEYENKK